MEAVIILVFVCLLPSTIIVTASVECNYCEPESSCWPSLQQFLDFNASLTGEVLFPSDPTFRVKIRMRNTRTMKYPYIVTMVETTEDIRRAVLFARNHQLRISIISSGHDYIGRSTADMSLQINVSRMKGRTVNLNSSRSLAGEIIAETGNTWIELYKELDKYGRLVVGGVEPTVALGGYTLGGGHSPIGRMFGLAVDNVLEIEMVTASGDIVVTNDLMTKTIDANGNIHVSSNTDLFWALRGGGGGTFGIVTKFTYKLHFAPKGFVIMDCMVPIFNGSLNEGRQYLKDINHLLGTTLPPEWGGYEWISGYTTSVTRGAVTLHMLHTGEYGSDSFNTILPFYQKYGSSCRFRNASSYLTWNINGTSGYYRIYIFNTLIQHAGYTDDLIDFIFNTSLQYAPTTEEYFFCAGTMIGGQMRNMSADSTAVNPSLRTGIVSLSCWMNWADPAKEDYFVAIGKNLTVKLTKFGKGTFLNEPSSYLPDWKTALWGGHYDRLLSVKKKWDPNNIFTCRHCVGSDIKTLSLTDAIIGRRHEHK